MLADGQSIGMNHLSIILYHWWPLNLFHNHSVILLSLFSKVNLYYPSYLESSWYHCNPSFFSCQLPVSSARQIPLILEINWLELAAASKLWQQQLSLLHLGLFAAHGAFRVIESSPIRLLSLFWYALTFLFLIAQLAIAICVALETFEAPTRILPLFLPGSVLLTLLALDLRSQQMTARTNGLILQLQPDANHQAHDRQPAPKAALN